MSIDCCWVRGGVGAVCIMHRHWLLSHSVLNKMMNTSEREILKGLQKISMQCTSQPVCDVTLQDKIDLDGGYIMHSSMLKRLKVSHDLFSWTCHNLYLLIKCHRMWCNPVHHNIKLNPLAPTSDQAKISPYNIITVSTRQVMRMKKNFNLGIISWSNIKFSDLTL